MLQGVGSLAATLRCHRNHGGMQPASDVLGWARLGKQRVTGLASLMLSLHVWGAGNRSATTVICTPSCRSLCQRAGRKVSLALGATQITWSKVVRRQGLRARSGKGKGQARMGLRWVAVAPGGGGAGVVEMLGPGRSQRDRLEPAKTADRDREEWRARESSSAWDGFGYFESSRGQ